MFLSLQTLRKITGWMIVLSAWWTLVSGWGTPAWCQEPDKQAYSSLLWGNLETLVGLGPRYPGSPGYDEAVQWIKRIGFQYADRIIERPFTIRRGNGQELRLANIEYRFEGTTGGRPLLIGTHFDTRPFADEEEDPQLRQQPILGANDGGSGTAILLALARYLKENKPRRPVNLVFFDGEDLGARGAGEMLIGSTYYARQLELLKREEWPYAVLVVDMVGDKNLEIYKETHSMQSSPELLDHIYSIAREKGFTQFREQSRHTIYDDHFPFMKMGIPSVLLIDFDYPHWHKVTDTLDKCSPESLFAVFSVVAHVATNR